MPLPHQPLPPKMSLRTISVRKCLNTFARGYQLVRAITCTVPVRKQSRKSIWNTLKPILLIFVFVIFTFSFFNIDTQSVDAQGRGNGAAEVEQRKKECNGEENCFIPLVGIPYIDNPNNISSMADYVSALYKISISIAAFLAVIKIIFAGVKYMLSDVVTDKGAAKKDIRGALIGLLIVIGAVLILNTINPQLRNLNVLSGEGVQVGLRDSGDIIPYSVEPGDSVKISYTDPDPLSRTNWAEACTRSGGTYSSSLYTTTNGRDAGRLFQCSSSGKIQTDSVLVEDDGTTTYNIQKGYSSALSFYGDDGIDREKWKFSCATNGGNPTIVTTGTGQSISMSLICN